MLTLAPIELREANEFVADHHRHSIPTIGHKFSICAAQGEKVIGVAIVGRPVARGLDDGFTLEALRVCTDGTRNACSFLYAAVARAARAMGYEQIVTYTLPEEGGASLRAAGWTLDSDSAGGGSWSRTDRPRTDQHPTQTKLRWSA